MEKSINSRKIALEILNNIDSNGSYSNLEINNVVNDMDIKIQDKNFISKLVYGVIENKIFLDYYISKLSTIRLKKINYKILNVLRLGIYQMKFLTKIPDSAAVNESVNLAKKVNFKSSGFVNGILRSFIRKGKIIELPDPNKDLEKYLSIKYSHPLWLVERWIKEYGEKFTKELLIANNSQPDLSFRVNTLKISREDLIESLISENVELEKSKKTKDGIKIRNLGNNTIRKLKGYNNGLFQVQDESSMLVAENLDVEPGMTVIDMCAAPGGKTTHIAQKMNNRGKIFAFDIYEHKIKLISDTARRLGISIIETSIQDGTIYNEKFQGLADRVLVDAPCTGLGIIRRKPEIKFNRKLEDINDLVEIQLSILETASKYLKSGGILLYSTCSIDFLEDENVVNIFLEKNKEFSLVENGTNKFFPNKDGLDGFFISKILKTK